MLKFNIFGRGRKLQWAITLACSMAFILFGYDQGVFGGIVTNANWMDTFDHPDSGLEGIIVSIYNLGAFSGCVIGFFTGERLGRRLSMWFAMIWIVSVVRFVDRVRELTDLRLLVPYCKRLHTVYRT